MSFAVCLLRLILLLFVMSYRAIKVFVVSIFVKNNADFFFREMSKWANGMLNATDTEVVVRGVENIEPSETYIYIANHVNYIDIPILVKAIPDKIHFMYRESLRKVPMLGIALKTSPFIPVIRESNKNAMEGINMAVESLNNSGSVILFPEGTRSKTGQLASFKRGAFLIAAKSNKKIIPVSIVGVEKVFPPNKKIYFSKGTVIVTINKPIELFAEERNELTQQINTLHTFLAEQINETQKEFNI